MRLELTGTDGADARLDAAFVCQCPAAYDAHTIQFAIGLGFLEGEGCGLVHLVDSTSRVDPATFIEDLSVGTTSGGRYLYLIDAAIKGVDAGLDVDLSLGLSLRGQSHQLIDHARG